MSVLRAEDWHRGRPANFHILHNEAHHWGTVLLGTVCPNKWFIFNKKTWNRQKIVPWLYLLKFLVGFHQIWFSWVTARDCWGVACCYMYLLCVTRTTMNFTFNEHICSKNIPVCSFPSDAIIIVLLQSLKFLFKARACLWYNGLLWNVINGGLGHLCAHNRLTCARRTSWGRWNEWDATALQTDDSKFEPWRSEAEHATSRSRRLPIILNRYEWAGKKHFVSLKLEGQSAWVRARNLRLSKQPALATAPGLPGPSMYVTFWSSWSQQFN